MIDKVFAIFDTKLGQYSKPIICPNKDVLLRTLRMELKNPNSQYNVCPSDFVLWYIGEYDYNKALFLNCDSESICSLDVLVESEVK